MKVQDKSLIYEQFVNHMGTEFVWQGKNLLTVYMFSHASFCLCVVDATTLTLTGETESWIFVKHCGPDSTKHLKT